jgi:hypothetical protein
MDQPKSEIPTEIKGFLETLLEDAQISSLDENKREEMLAELYERLDSFMAAKIVDNMPPEYLDEFIKLNQEKKPQEEIDKFVKEKMPNSEDVFTNAFVEFRNLYVGSVALSKNAPKADQ